MLFVRVQNKVIVSYIFSLQRHNFAGTRHLSILFVLIYKSISYGSYKAFVWWFRDEYFHAGRPWVLTNDESSTLKLHHESNLIIQYQGCTGIARICTGLTGNNHIYHQQSGTWPVFEPVCPKYKLKTSPLHHLD